MAFGVAAQRFVIAASFLWALLGADGRVLRRQRNTTLSVPLLLNITKDDISYSSPALRWTKDDTSSTEALAWQKGFNGTFQLANGSWNPAYSFSRKDVSVDEQNTFHHPGRACLSPPQKAGYFCPCSCAMATENTKGEIHNGVKCPSPDDSDEQDRFICMWTIKNVLPDLPTKNVKVLHLAPDKSVVYGLGLMHSPRVTQYVLGDTNVPMARKRLPDQQITYVDVTNIPFADATFDLVICMNVLEHVPNDKKAMRELFRVMKPGALGFVEADVDWDRKLTVENTSTKTNWPFDQENNVRLYGKDYVTKAEAAGFDVRVVNQKWWYRSLKDSIGDFDLEVLSNPEYHREYKTTVFSRPS